MANEKRLIDVNPFMKTGWHLVRTGKSNEHLASLSLADVPTVDAVEVVHGRWDKAYIAGYLKCSCCNDAFIYKEWIESGKWNYCPNCGAKLDGERSPC